MRTATTRVWIGLAAALLGAAAVGAQPPPPPVGGPPPAVADLPPADGVPPPPPPGGDGEGHAGAFLFGADYLLMKPRRRPFDFAVVGPDSPFGPQGDVRSLTWDTASGFRAGGGYRLPGAGWEVGFFYTFLHSDAAEAAARPADGNLFATLTHPSQVELADVAAASAELDYHVFDLELGRRFRPAEGLAVRAFAGPRFAHIGQALTARYDGLDAVRERVDTCMHFSGGGVRVGGEGTWDVWGGLGLYARGGASLLAGSFRTALLETANDGATAVVNVTDRFRKVVPVLELGLGVSWQYRGWRLAAGYEFVNWFGLVDGVDFVDDVHRGKPARRTGDLSLDGLVLRAELAF